MTVRSIQAIIINPTINTTEYTRNFVTNPANVREFDAAKNAVPAHNPSTIPEPPFLGAIYSSTRKELAFKGETTPLRKE